MDIAKWFAAAALAGMAMNPNIAIGGQLSVDPILLEISAPAAAGVLNLQSQGDGETVVQIRVMRWSQSDGKETLVPATDVVASPPAVRLAPNTRYIVRVVRTAKTPFAGEASYRVIIDQLPNLQQQQAETVNLLIRQSIPVFFESPGASSARVKWSFRKDGGKVWLVATNSGQRRMRISSLKLRDAAGLTISFGNGLVGYALGLSSMSWVLPTQPRGFGAGGAISITAQTERGPLDASARWLGQ